MEPLKHQQTATPSFALDFETEAPRSELAVTTDALPVPHRELKFAPAEIIALRDLEKNRRRKIKELELQLAEKQLLLASRGCEVDDLKAEVNALLNRLGQVESASHGEATASAGTRPHDVQKKEVPEQHESTAPANRGGARKRRWRTGRASKRRWKLSP